jgi:hypothetical protein
MMMNPEPALLEDVPVGPEREPARGLLRVLESEVKVVARRVG